MFNTTQTVQIIYNRASELSINCVLLHTAIMQTYSYIHYQKPLETVENAITQTCYKLLCLGERETLEAQLSSEDEAVKQNAQRSLSLIEGDLLNSHPQHHAAIKELSSGEPPRYYHFYVLTHLKEICEDYLARYNGMPIHQFVATQCVFEMALLRGLLHS